MSTHVRNIDALSTQTRQYALRVLGSVGELINPDAWEWYRTHVGGGICPVVEHLVQLRRRRHPTTDPHRQGCCGSC